jgi:hypothetical protein
MASLACPGRSRLTFGSSPAAPSSRLAHTSHIVHPGGGIPPPHQALCAHAHAALAQQYLAVRAQDIQPTPGGACATTGRIRRNMVVDDSHRCSRRVCHHRRASPKDVGDRILGSAGCWLSLTTPLPTVKMTDNGDPVEQIQADFARPDGAAVLVASAERYGYFHTWHLRQQRLH